MIDARVDRLVAALLYEGYILYPYRPSVKNHKRWTIGGVYPPDQADTDGSGDGDRMRTECLVEGASPVVDVTLRWLHVVDRQVGKFASPQSSFDAAHVGPYEPVGSLQVNDERYQSWQEAVERKVVLPGVDLAAIANEPVEVGFSLPAGRTVEPIAGTGGEIVGVLVRSHRQIAGTVRLSAERLDDALHRLAILVTNRTGVPESPEADVDDPILRTMVSTHTVVQATSGSFVSLLEPSSARLIAAADGCANVRTWPVLVGEPGGTDLLLSSPIILYDYPQLAPESPGDLFDGTEIDEILSLRIQTLSDEEKQQMRGVDRRARELLERTESLDAERFAALHGALRGLRAASPEEDAP